MGGGALANADPARLTPAEGRRFALTVGTAFCVLAGVFWWRDRPLGTAMLGGLGVLLILAGLVAPRHMGPVQRAWMGLAHLISRVTTPILLATIYFLVITPIGLLVRLRGKNPLRRRPVNGSYWIERSPDRRRSDLRRQF